MEKSNVKAMREALVIVKRLFDGRLMWQPDIRKAHEAVDAALAKPPRNCDVGTAEEQTRRWNRFCYRHECLSCPVKPIGEVDCILAWSQMPYDETK